KTLSLLSSTINGPFQNDGTLAVKGGSSITGAFGTGLQSLIQIAGDPSTGFARLTSGPFTNNGQIELNSSVTNRGLAQLQTATSVAVTNAPGAKITTIAGTGGTRELTVTLINQGTVTLNANTTLDGATASHANTGTIDGTNADLTVSNSASSFTNVGSLLI